jgi:SAM-dependent methyltransferase
MKLGALPENPLELAALAARLAPTPLLDTLIALLLAHSVLAATQLGVFETLASGPLTAEAVAERCGTEPRATEKLLGALAGAGYLRFRAGRFGLAPIARKWLLKDSPHSLYDALLLQVLDARFVARTEEFVRTGEPANLHGTLSLEEWALYQRGMRSGANLVAGELARRIPVPKGARDLLDIGGGHGYYSVALCKRHADLHAVVLDLPEAVAAAAPLLAREGLGDRVRHQTGDALTADLGTDAYDVILIANLLHHFVAEQCTALVERAARALRPGGILVIGDMVRPRFPGAGGQLGALTDLYFALTSRAGTYALDEMAGWQRAAGLRPKRPIRLLTGPGAALLVGVKVRS